MKEAVPVSRFSTAQEFHFGKKFSLVDLKSSVEVDAESVAIRSVPIATRPIHAVVLVFPIAAMPTTVMAVPSPGAGDPNKTDAWCGRFFDDHLRFGFDDLLPHNGRRLRHWLLGLNLR